MTCRNGTIPQPSNEKYEEAEFFPLTYREKEEPRKAKLRTRIEMLKRKYSTSS